MIGGDIKKQITNHKSQIVLKDGFTPTLNLDPPATRLYTGLSGSPKSWQEFKPSLTLWRGIWRAGSRFCFPRLRDNIQNISLALSRQPNRGGIRNNPNLVSGFTLLEMIVSTGIFSILVIASIGIML